MLSAVQRQTYWGAIASLLVALFFWALVPLMLKQFTHWLDPWTANGSRYFLAASFWAPFVYHTLRTLPGSAQKAAFRAALAPAAAHTISQIAFGLAPYFTSATLINFGCRLSIPFATIFGFWLLRSERPLARQPFFWVGLAAAMGGFLWMFAAGGGRGTNSDPVGRSLLLGFAAAWGLYVVLVRRNLSGYPAHLAYGLVSLVTAFLLVILMFFFGNWRSLISLTGGQWLWLAFSALIGLTLGHALYYRAIRVLGPIASESGMLLIPFQTALMAQILLGEKLSFWQWGAGLVLLAGCSLLLRARFLARSGG